MCSDYCSFCKQLIDTFDYSSTIIYRLKLENLKTPEEGQKLLNLLNTLTNSEETAISTLQIIRFDYGKVRYVSHGYVDTSNKYNYDLLVSVIEGTFTGDHIEYQ